MKTPHNWYNLSQAATLESLKTQDTGLSSDEANQRLATYGPNLLPAPHRKSALARFAQQFHNLLIYILLLAGVITAILEHWIDSGVIIAVVLINAIIGYIQEGKAEKALEAITHMLSLEANVIRNGKQLSIPAENVVPGDIVTLQSGDKVPADLRLLRTRDLRIDEAILTGESLPADKSEDTCESDVPLGDRHCMAFSGTLVTYGTATGVVVETAANTEIGQISEMLSDVRILETPLLRRIGEFARWLTMAILIITSMTFIFGISVQNFSMTDMFIAAVGLAVAAIPEGLPAIITITLAIGVQAMAKRKAIIRRLPAVETLGSVTTICSDKTGTLTCNEMTVKSISTSDNQYDVSGVGYAPHGKVTEANNQVELSDAPVLNQLTQAALLCNDAVVHSTTGIWQVNGDPTEGALVTLAIKAGLQHDQQAAQHPRLDAIPFESEHRFMATLHHDHQGRHFMFLKGAPERLLEMCDLQRTVGGDTPIDKTYWESQMHNMAVQGQRVLAIACKEMPNSLELTFSDTEKDLVLLGIVGMIDPPRTEAIDAVKACHSAGINVKMITGDHATTASAIGKALGIGDGQTVLTGNEIDSMTNEQLKACIDDIDIYARTSPQHKLRLVEILQSKGHIVSMTGDGVNDAPALKRADVGVAMGMKGTSVAKETSEMVLVDDNFASIVNAVEEGRTVYDNIKKAIIFILPTNGGEALTIIAAIALGRLLPITPVQILWVNMITAVTLALALAFEPAERGVMQRPPRDPSEPLLTGFLIWRVIFVSLILVSGTFGLFILERDAGASIEYARTVAVNMLVVFEIYYLFNSRFIYEHSLRIETFTGNRFAIYAVLILICFQVLFTYAPPLQVLFSTAPLTIASWGNILVTGVSVFVLVEIEKFFFRNRQLRNNKHNIKT